MSLAALALILCESIIESSQVDTPGCAAASEVLNVARVLGCAEEVM